MRSFGESMTTLMFLCPPNAASAAAPMSPVVAPSSVRGRPWANDVSKSLRHELQGNVVEGKRRTVRKLEQADLIVEPLHGRDLLGREHTAGVAEVAGLIGFGADLPEILLRELLGEEADDLEGERGVGEAAPRHQGVGVDLREHRRRRRGRHPRHSPRRECR